MFDDVDRSLGEWVATVAEGADVSFDAPGADVERATVRLDLLNLHNGVPTRRDQQANLEISLHYLVSVEAPDAQVAHRLLGKLVLAAQERSDFLVELRAVEPSLWAAFGVAPRPAFILQCPFTLERPVRAPRIRKPAEVRVSPVGDVNGVVLSRDDVPIVRARIELPDIGAVSYTDANGRFHFGAVPMQTTARPLRIVARGTELRISERVRPDQPLVIRFEPQET